MGAAARGRGRMGEATLASLTIHVLVALAIPALAWTASTVTPVETISFKHIVHIEVVPPRLPHPPPRAIAPRRDPRPIVNFASHVHLVSARPHLHATSEPAVATNAPVAPAIGAVARAGEGNTSGNAVPDATPSPVVRAAASVGERQTGGYLPFGAEQPDPVLDPGVRKQLESLDAHVTLIVTVGDDGRTKDVLFDPPIDPQLQSRIKSLLADASWDPAVCGGGVPCEAQATIKL
jgi:hypothetical protein